MIEMAPETAKRCKEKREGRGLFPGRAVRRNRSQPFRRPSDVIHLAGYSACPALTDVSAKGKCAVTGQMASHHFDQINSPDPNAMNYRHAFHAGNFADVVKHSVLARLVEYLKLKDKAFRVIDTHAGTGLYDLSSEQAHKTGEWQGGIARLHEKPLTDLPPIVQRLSEHGAVAAIQSCR